MQKPLFYIDPQKAEKNIQFYKKVFNNVILLNKNDKLYIDCNGNLKKNNCWNIFWFLDIHQFFPYETEKHVLDYVNENLDEYFNVMDDFYFASKLNKKILDFAPQYIRFNEKLIKGLNVLLYNLSFKTNQLLFYNKLNECKHICNIFYNKLNELR